MTAPFAVRARTASRRRATCVHCGRRRRLITGDGVVVCRVCLLAWGDYARLINPVAPAPRELGPVDFAHLGHGGLYVADCGRCILRDATGPFGRWLGSRFLIP